ncbi:RICIN domain-containing protein [Streptomyces sp. NPDC090108]|uniref:RICIN domain-containing protein n=1 Tax=Streptomyces sp. NPDC090108 TaxID=3365947 RepID=UPI003826DA7E
MVTAAVVVVLAITVPFVLSTSKHDDVAAPASKVTEAAQEQQRTHRIGSLPSTSPVRRSPSASPDRKKPAAGTGVPDTPVEQPTTPQVEKKAKAASKPDKPLSPAAVERARANTASHTTGALLKNVASGLCADLPGYGNGKSDGGVNTHACDGTSADNQQWDLQATGSAQGPDGAELFVIRNHKDGLCMTPVFRSGDSTAWIREGTCDTSTTGNGLWWLMPRADGSYAVRNYSLGSCLNEANPAPGGYHDDRLDQAPCAEGGSARTGWSFA